MRNYIFVILVLYGTACSLEVDPPMEGPNGSWWTGGADGGVFVKIQDDGNTSDQIYTGTIYYEHDKTVWYSGRFELVGSTAFDPSDKSQYAGWDGDELFLKNGSYLKSLDPIPDD